MISEATAKQNNEYVEVLEPSDLKLRSIVAGPTCLTRLLRDLLDKNLKPFILYVKSYVTHSFFDFLERCSRINNENTILATVNVASLYTNVPHVLLDR